MVPGENTSKAAQRLTKVHVHPSGPDLHDDLAKGQYLSLLKIPSEAELSSSEKLILNLH
jgi:hypothetical protein